jgi:hypothetical protein
MDIDKLELNTETLRQLSEDELTHVAGGAQLTGTETYHCPTQATNPLIACGNLTQACAG